MPFFLLLLVTFFLHFFHPSALADTTPIARVKSEHFVKEGSFFGGVPQPADLVDLRMGQHPQMERWVFDFTAPEKSEVAEYLPLFQILYQPAKRARMQDGSVGILKKARFILSFEGIHENQLSQKRIKPWIEKSHHVTDLIVYPQIEGGGMSLELLLNEDVLFEVHQPAVGSGKIVLDLKKIQFSDIANFSPLG